MIRQAVWSAALVVLAASSGRARADDPAIPTFERQELIDEYYSEGVGVGDLNRDGHADVVYGPVWFAGPDFRVKREIYAPRPQDREGYADHFFAWIYDFDGDGWNDILTAGFPGTPGFVYQNPGDAGQDRHWPKHEVLAHVSNESPQFTDLVGDGRPELVCTKEGFFGYAVIDPTKPFGEWPFHAISEKVAPVPFGHGLGVGDVNGDGRMDVLMQDGWFEQPASLNGDPKWAFHEVPFCPVGGADLFAYDVDGDGDNDVITSLEAHSFGLAWHEQAREGDKTTFRQHLIMGNTPEQNRHGVVFSELHSVALADIDGDGLKDIVTGKTYYSHHKQAPQWDAGAVVYWFRLVRGPDGVDWVPYKADGESGIGRQLVVADINGDGLPDLAAGGMKGANILIQKREKKDQAAAGRPATPRPAHAAIERRDPNSRAAHAQLLAKAKQGKIDVYFEGDSITRRWGATDYPAFLARWNGQFHGWNAANFAWGGDTTHNILWRLRNGELDGVSPKVVVLQAGTNNLPWTGPADDAAVEDVVGGIEAILATFREETPDATIVLTALFPRPQNRELAPTIARINERLATLADGSSIRFVNINDRLADDDGEFLPGVSRDGLHLEAKGYDAWASALRPIFEEVLGPPTETDEAPPPSGNPGAAGRSGARR